MLAKLKDYPSFEPNCFACVDSITETDFEGDLHSFSFTLETGEDFLVYSRNEGPVYFVYINGIPIIHSTYLFVVQHYINYLYTNILEGIFCRPFVAFEGL